jgi:hypothetical protein
VVGLFVAYKERNTERKRDGTRISEDMPSIAHEGKAVGVTADEHFHQEDDDGKEKDNGVTTRLRVVVVVVRLAHAKLQRSAIFV